MSLAIRMTHVQIVANQSKTVGQPDWKLVTVTVQEARALGLKTGDMRCPECHRGAYLNAAGSLHAEHSADNGGRTLCRLGDSFEGEHQIAGTPLFDGFEIDDQSYRAYRAVA